MYLFLKKVFHGFLIAAACISFFALQDASARTCDRYKGKLDLETSRSAYPTNPYQPKGQSYAYVAFVWREPAATQAKPDIPNHTLSVIRSRNLLNWEDSCGTAISLPVRLETAEVVDHINLGEGLFNIIRLSGDNRGRPVITYIKYVKVNGKKTTQVFNARLESTGWVKYQMTDFTTQWELIGGGSLPPTDYRVSYGGIEVLPDGRMRQLLRKSVLDMKSKLNNYYEISNDKDGRMVRGDPITKASETLDAFYTSEPFPKKGVVPQKTPSGFKTKFVYTKKAATSWDRWIPIRGDFDGDGLNNSAIYDSDNYKFIYWKSGNSEKYSATVLPFGCKDKTEVKCRLTGVWEPLVGSLDWGTNKNSPYQSIGLYRPTYNGSEPSILLNISRPPTGDEAVWKQVQVDAGAVKNLNSLKTLDDNVRNWYSRKPAALYRVVWSQLPANRDKPYSCNGKPLTYFPQKDKPEVVCPKKFSRNLIYWQYNETKEKWESQLIDKMWGAAVGANFLSFKGHQYVVYFNKNRFLTVAYKHAKDSITEKWKIKTLDSQFRGWDSHNKLEIYIDQNHSIHIAGNQHADPLNYFFSPGLDIDDLKRAPLTGEDESKVTYPKFFRNPEGDLIFSYRNGRAGDGDTYYNIYDPATMKWSRLLDEPLFGGK